MCAGNCGPDLAGNGKIEAGKTERTADKAGNWNAEHWLKAKSVLYF